MHNHALSAIETYLLIPTFRKVRDTFDNPGHCFIFSASLNSWQMNCVALIMLESLICLSSDNTIFSHLGAGARFPDFYCVFYVTKLCVSTKAMFQWRVSFCEWRFTHDTIFMVDDSLLLHIFPRFFDKTSAFQPI